MSCAAARGAELGADVFSFAEIFERWGSSPVESSPTGVAVKWDFYGFPSTKLPEIR